MLLLSVAAGVVACGDEEEREPAGEAGGVASPERAPQDVATGLEVPWALAVAPDGAIFLTERPGRVRVIADGALRPEPVAEIAVVQEGEGGLLGLALHPGFPETPHAYLYATRPGEGGVAENVITRHRLVPGGPAGWRLTGETRLLGGIPPGRIHQGGRLAFGPDGMLYATTGDAGDPALAADLASPAGKILRLDPEGGVPADNPFPGSPVYSYGHRNPQGLAWDDDGRLYASEHGPSGEFGLCCRDEVNRIEPGGFYGWPLRAGDGPAGASEPLRRRLPEPIDPIATAGEDDTWAPGGLAALTIDGSTALMVPELGGERLRRLRIDPADPDAVVGEDVVLDGLGRLRAATVGPDGCLLLTTSNRDGRGDPRDADDRVVRACVPPDE